MVPGRAGPYDAGVPPRPALFLDRDGTLIEDVDYLTRVEQIRLLPEAAAAVRAANEAGIPIVLVSNQSAIAREMLTEEGLAGIHAELTLRLAAHGARLDAFYYCPHLPEAGASPHRRACDCRKPAPGMLLRAAREHALDLTRSGAIGDHPRDIEAARRAGCPHLRLIASPAELPQAVAEIVHKMRFLA